VTVTRVGGLPRQRKGRGGQRTRWISMKALQRSNSGHENAPRNVKERVAVRVANEVELSWAPRKARQRKERAPLRLASPGAPCQSQRNRPCVVLSLGRVALREKDVCPVEQPQWSSNGDPVGGVSISVARTWLDGATGPPSLCRDCL
jgi:hypothetical protein